MVAFVPGVRDERLLLPLGVVDAVPQRRDAGVDVILVDPDDDGPLRRLRGRAGKTPTSILRFMLHSPSAGPVAFFGPRAEGYVEIIGLAFLIVSWRCCAPYFDVLARRKPMLRFRSPGEYLKRPAERQRPDKSPQQPPRRTRPDPEPGPGASGGLLA